MSKESKLWVCKWPEGSVSIVRAESKLDAVMVLDEEAGAREEWVSPLSSKLNFYVSYVAGMNPDMEEAEWATCDIPEDVLEVLGDPQEAMDLQDDKDLIDAVEEPSLAGRGDDDSLEVAIEALSVYAAQFRRVTDKTSSAKAELFLHAASSLDSAIKALEALHPVSTSVIEGEGIQ